MRVEPFAVVVRKDGFAPGVIFEVPFYSCAEMFFEGFCRSPVDLVANFFAVESIATVMTGAIIYEGDELFVWEMGGIGKKFIEERAEHFDQFEVGEFVVAADVVNVSWSAFL